jgi:ribosomal protein S15P/S13E
MCSLGRPGIRAFVLKLQGLAPAEAKGIKHTLAPSGAIKAKESPSGATAVRPASLCKRIEELSAHLDQIDVDNSSSKQATHPASQRQAVQSQCQNRAAAAAGTEASPAPSVTIVEPAKGPLSSYPNRYICLVWATAFIMSMLPSLFP